MLFPGQKLGKYTIVTQLGSGGFGTVYRARDTWIDKDVAIKVPHRQQVNFSELLREPRLLAALNHPNIVSITTAEKQENVFFIVMEYVHGATLEQIIADGGAVETRRALAYAMQICDALEHAHRQSVIHRDLRPPNVLISDAGQVKVADFGTSRFIEIAARGTTVIGSPAYMAPEQFEGRAVFGSDIYSLGVTLYQMLTGTLPYDAPTPRDLDKLMRGELVEPPRRRNPAIPAALNAVIMKAMAPDLRNRYQSARELRADLEVIRLRRRAPATSTVAAGAALPRPAAVGSRATPAAASVSLPGARRFCRQCHKPLHARSDRCPFCGEIQ